jgi:hypothetical protein
MYIKCGLFGSWDYFREEILPGLPPAVLSEHCAITPSAVPTPCSPAHAICGGAVSKHSNYLNESETKRLIITSDQIKQFEYKKTN